jgi:hypothetical protein
MSYRQLANRSARYQALHRDAEIDIMGVQTKIRRPDSENSLNYYGDFVSSYLPDDDISVVPQYNKYYQVIDVLGYCVEPELPLEALVKTTDYVPNDSVILIGVRSLSGTIQNRWWRVLSTEVKHIENVYARVAKLSPTREPIGVHASITISAQSTVTINEQFVPAVSRGDFSFDFNLDFGA